MNNVGDITLALEIHQRLNNNVGVTENAILPKNAQGKEYIPRTMVDHTLELIDPTPNIYTLFVQFNTRYFWNKLLPVEVKWSKRMTTCAGVCSFHPRNKQCIITLSAPLLKLRPRKDLVETLLHEMIHGYLFLTNNNRDRDGHGPEFHKHMYRINKEAGTDISVYHDFHDEVRLYQQHWWRCNGPCQKRAPYFGTVRRAMNRAPGPNDNWWKMHQQTCGGQFIKVKEPQKEPAKGKKSAGKKLPDIVKSKDISDWLTKPDNPKNHTPLKTVASPKKSTNDHIVSKTVSKAVPSSSHPSTFTKLGNTSNNIHGWGTGGPSNLVNAPTTSNASTKTPKFRSNGVLGGSGRGKSNLLDKFPSSKAFESKKPTIIKPELKNGNGIAMNSEIVDLCETPNKRKSTSLVMTSNKMPKIDGEKVPEKTKCPVCDKPVSMSKLNDHLDECLISASASDRNHSTPKSSKNRNNNLDDSSQASKINIESSPIVIDDSSGSDILLSPPIVDGKRKCLVCDDFIDPGVTLSDHLEACIGSAFTDDSIPEFEENDAENTNGDQPKEQSFPCPICMKFIKENIMNQHLDTCLSKDLLKNYAE
ncbi:DNA-dependent metalloprotease dvc-1 isoform X1 [Neodiprion fabricii]|uniref:DNA-dependent metalloprotease dvc-1 isoform X1 n=2 Tax=Neodiprion fabricii TaxID=2872261 RepID=UPI001ED90BD6|nr:DNA-dependent metalloprotease dvc-1 isoform X1 [Neodiprion fabricii]